MREQILKRLKKFEKDNNVEVIIAVESGSRGWGFASEDSDYDVRFVYKHPVARYVELQPPPMSHEWMDGEADYVGFDIHKFYDLLYKSNMNIIDWLMQDVIYIDNMKGKEALKKCVSKYFDRRTYVEHNLGLCSKNYGKYIALNATNEPTAKKYVYCIRALLSAKYCNERGEIAPLKFQDLVAKTLTASERKELDEMLEAKKKTREKEGYRNAKWKGWIEANLKMPIAAENSKETAKYYEALNSHMKMQFGELNK